MQSSSISLLPPWPSSPSFLCSRRATITRLRQPPSLSARCRFSASPSKTRMQRANSWAWCAPATRRISASGSPARSSAASSMSAMRVQVGDVVARLDPQDLKLQVESAEAEFAAATSSLHQAASDLERYTTLKTRGWASIADFDRKKAAKDEAEGRLERAKRSLDLAHNQLDYSDLKADADGVITATLAEPGQVVAIGQPVVRLAHRGEKEAVVALPETWLTEARSSKATVQLWSGPGRNFAARLRELSPQADAATRTYAARFTIENPDELCRARHDCDGDTLALRRCLGGEAAARGDPQPWDRPIGLCGRQVRCARAATGEGCVLHRGHGACHLRRQQWRPNRQAWRPEARRR